MLNTKTFIVCCSFVFCYGAIVVRGEESELAGSDLKMCEQLACKVSKKCQAKKRSVLFVAGGTASGKSTLAKIWKEGKEMFTEYSCDYVHLDTDEIMLMLDEWKEEASGDNAACAANKLYSKASNITKKCFNYLIQNGYDVVYDGTMSDYSGTFHRIRLAEEHGYRIGMFAVTVDAAEAAKRSITKAKGDNQYVPLCEIASNHAKFSNSFLTYVALIPKNQLYDNTQREPKLIFSENRVLDNERFDAFLAKSNVTYDQVLEKTDHSIKEQYEELHQKCDTCRKL